MSTTTIASLPDFVQRHLSAAASIEGFRPGYTCRDSAGTKPGDGFSSVIRVIELRGPRCDPQTGRLCNDDKVTLVLKLLPDGVERQKVFHSRIVFEREVHFYVKILPVLQRFQRDKGLTPSTGFYGYPHCYAAVADAETDEYVIVMRDLRTVGYDLWDKMRPMPFENARLLFEQLGRMTGISLALQDQRPEQFADIRDMDDIWTGLLKTGDISRIIQPFYDQAVELIDSMEHKRVLIEMRDNWPEIVTHCVERRDSFSVLAHGDCWNNNMMFAGTEVSKVFACIVCHSPSKANFPIPEHQSPRLADMPLRFARSGHCLLLQFVHGQSNA